VDNRSGYGIDPSRLAAIGSDYEAYVAAEAEAANPDTATKGARRERDGARVRLERQWRRFLNENIRYNTQVSVADLTVFGIRSRDATRTQAHVPTATGVVTVKRRGAFEFEVTVIDAATSKRRLPDHAAGSYLFLAVTETGVIPEALETYRMTDFSSNARHILRFPSNNLVRQANLYVRYVNRHGREGPAGQIKSFVIH
jgi:hypothetical protein